MESPRGQREWKCQTIFYHLYNKVVDNCPNRSSLLHSFSLLVTTWYDYRCILLSVTFLYKRRTKTYEKVHLGVYLRGLSSLLIWSQSYHVFSSPTQFSVTPVPRRVTHDDISRTVLIRRPCAYLPQPLPQNVATQRRKVVSLVFLVVTPSV